MAIALSIDDIGPISSQKVTSERQTVSPSCQHTHRESTAAAAHHRPVDTGGFVALFVAIDFNHRYARPVQLAAEAIRAGRLGDITFATWRFGGEGDTPHPDGNLIETQCHGFDMLEHLAGPIASVFAEFTERPGRGHSTLSIALRFESGAVGSLVGSYDSSYAYRDTHRVEVNGTAGRVLVVDTVRRFEFQAAANETAEVWEAGYFNDLDRGFHRTLDRHVDEILAALRAGGRPPIPVEAGRRALQLALASVQSFADGRRVATPACGLAGDHRPPQPAPLMLIVPAFTWVGIRG
jgi:myo-inositol 2-dehydrogenase/D-chiro-inositol 1-dehydrogenase